MVETERCLLTDLWVQQNAMLHCARLLRSGFGDSALDLHTSHFLSLSMTMTPSTPTVNSIDVCMLLSLYRKLPLRAIMPPFSGKHFENISSDSPSTHLSKPIPSISSSSAIQINAVVKPLYFLVLDCYSFVPCHSPNHNATLIPAIRDFRRMSIDRRRIIQRKATPSPPLPSFSFSHIDPFKLFQSHHSFLPPLYLGRFHGFRLHFLLLPCWLS